MDKEILNVKSLAEFLGMSESKVYQLVQTGKIPSSRIGRSYRFVRSEVVTWLKNGGTKAREGV